MQHKFISDPARPEEAGLFIPLHPEEDKRLGTSLAMSGWTSGAAETSSGIPGGPVAGTEQPAFKLELQEVVDTLRECAENRFAMERFCYEHGGKIDGGYVQNYGYIVKRRRYATACAVTSLGDYNGYLTCFDLDVQRQNMARTSLWWAASPMPMAMHRILPMLKPFSRVCGRNCRIARPQLPLRGADR